MHKLEFKLEFKFKEHGIYVRTRNRRACMLVMRAFNKEVDHWTCNTHITLTENNAAGR